MIANRFSLFVGIFSILVSSFAFAQKTRTQLEREKKENLKKIEETNKILEETKAQKTVSLGQLTALKEKITNTQSLIYSIASEITFLEGEMAELELIAQSMQQDLDTLKKEYALMVYAASKATNNTNKLFYIFSAKTFNQLFMRMKFMEQYSEERKIQVEQIQKVKKALLGQMERLKVKRNQKNQLLLAQRKQNTNLGALKVQQDNLVQELSKKERDLVKELAERKKSVEKLDKSIGDAIAKEIKKTSNGSSSDKVTLTPQTSLLSNSFEGNKARLVWPVASGFISQKFGRQEHPVLKGIMIENNGINIQTNKGEPVRSVFDGKVEMVTFIGGMGTVVMVNHGEYFTVYGSLSTTNVKKDQLLKAKDIIGDVMTDKNGISEVHFEIWKNMTRLDPQGWLFANTK